MGTLSGYIAHIARSGPQCWVIQGLIFMNRIMGYASFQLIDWSESTTNPIMQILVEPLRTLEDCMIYIFISWKFCLKNGK